MPQTGRGAPSMVEIAAYSSRTVTSIDRTAYFCNALCFAGHRGNFTESHLRMKMNGCHAL
ncbi:MAG: hypothetical protein LW863_08890 [Flammeovirgaceae bacterium]|nr:hypothetical protein [Flammeovirgaceae bacterium]